MPIEIHQRSILFSPGRARRPACLGHYLWVESSVWSPVVGVTTIEERRRCSSHGDGVMIMADMLKMRDIWSGMYMERGEVLDQRYCREKNSLLGWARPLDKN